MQAQPPRDQAYYESLARSYAGTHDLVHGVAAIASICEHDLELGCPSGVVDEPTLIEIETDWLPERYHLDRTLPILGSASFENETGVPAYFALARFPGLEFQPDANLVCNDEQAVPGWRKIMPPLMLDSILENDGIDHEGLRRAIEEGAADTSRPINEAGGLEMILCGGPSD